jgi:hypothetical protein
MISFKGAHYPKDVIFYAVFFYVRYADVRRQLSWDELREKHFHNRVFDGIDALENHLVDALRVVEQDRY